MARALKILVGTMTGTADMVAQEIADMAVARGVAAEIVQMDGQDASVFAGGGLFLVCTSTYGQGDVPDNARDLVTALESDRPDLSDVRFGLIALGDRTYATTYCAGGMKFDDLLCGLGAVRVGEPFLHDASAGTIPEDEAVAWVGDWLDIAWPESAAA